MTLTNEEFKTSVSEIFADGSPITDDKFAALSEAITQLQQPSAGGGDLTVSVPAELSNTGLDTRLHATVTKTETGQNLEIGVGPWYNILLREIYAKFPNPVEFVYANTTYKMPEDLIVKYGPLLWGAYYTDTGFVPGSQMAWRVMLNGSRVIYAVNWDEAVGITVHDLKKQTKNTYPGTSLNGSLPEELKSEGVLTKVTGNIGGDRWNVGRLLASNKNTIVVERADVYTGETIKVLYEYSILTHSSGVAFNEESKFQHGLILKITAATFIEEYIDPENTNTFKRRITKIIT